MFCDITPNDLLVDNPFESCKQVEFTSTGLDCFDTEYKKVLVLTY